MLKKKDKHYGDRMRKLSFPKTIECRCGKVMPIVAHARDWYTAMYTCECGYHEAKYVNA